MATQAFAERSSAVTFRGAPMTLVGAELHRGDPAPDFTLTTSDLQAFTLNEAIDNGNRAALLIVVPSLDTNTCSLETQTFHKRLEELPNGVAAFVVSLDLPFAQQRWAKANDAVKLTYLSDFREHSFGAAYGVLIKELGLLTRALFLVAKDRTIAYSETVPEVASEPNYEAVFHAAKSLK